jgi:hypothetical protein
MVMQRPPVNAMAPLPVPMANSVAALQPLDIAVRVPKVPLQLEPSDSPRSKREGTTNTKKYSKERALKEFGITSEDYDEWRRSDNAHSHMPGYNYRETQDRIGAPDKFAQNLIGPGAGYVFDNNTTVVDPMAIDRDYRRLRDEGFTHGSALSQIYHAYGWNGYALNNIPKDSTFSGLYPEGMTKYELREYIRPYNGELIG